MMGKLYRSFTAWNIPPFASPAYGPGKQTRHGKMSLRSRMVEDPYLGKPVSITGADQLDDIIYVDNATRVW